MRRIWRQWQRYNRIDLRPPAWFAVLAYLLWLLFQMLDERWRPIVIRPQYIVLGDVDEAAVIELRRIVNQSYKDAAEADGRRLKGDDGRGFYYERE